MNRRFVAIVVAIVVVALAGIAFIVWQVDRTPRAAGLLKVLSELLQDLPKPEQRIGQIILDSYVEYRANTVRWSGVYFGSLFLSAAFAALAAVVLKFQLFITNDDLKKDSAALLSVLSALLITLSTTGDFAQKWRANRLAAAKMERLGYAFITAVRPADVDFFSGEIQTITYERNVDILADQRAPAKPAEKK